MKVYGLKVALRHEKEKDTAIIKINKKPTLIATVEDIGSEAKKHFPQITIGSAVLTPFVASATVNEICYVSAYDLIGYFESTQ